MNKKLVAISVLLITASLLLFAIVFSSEKTLQAENDKAYFTFTDSLGNEVILTEKPEKVAVLFSSLCQVWKNSGGKAYITVGESIERGFCEDSTLLVDSGAGKAVNNELLLSYEPDFVIYSSDVPAQRQTGELLSASGIPSAGIRLDSFDDYLKALEIFCGITGNEHFYKIFGQNTSNDIDFIINQTKKIKTSPKILFIRSGSSQSSCKAKKAEDNFVAKMLEELGCINIADSAPTLVDGLSAEEILINRPDYIFVSLMGDEEAGKNFVQEVFRSDIYKALDSEIIFLEKELYQYKPCEDWNLAYRGLAEVLYPQLFLK